MAIDSYDPNQAPDPGQWLALDEGARIELALKHHVSTKVELPNVRVHATMHAAVENQVALGDETPVREKLRQLMAQGLDRHDAIHAIAAALAEYVWRVARDPVAAGEVNKGYYAALRRLNARKWRRSR
jgi:hypothetical protein